MIGDARNLTDKGHILALFLLSYDHRAYGVIRTLGHFHTKEALFH